MVLKFLQGGGFGFVEFNPLILNDLKQQETPAKKTNNENQGLLDDQIKKLLGDFKGLPSDLQYIIGELLRFNINLQYGIDTGNSAALYLNILGKLKYAEFNNSEYEKTLEEISKNGGLNEIAISRNGLIYCMNSEKDARLMTIDLLSKLNEYKPLTNSELLNMRAHDPSLAFNSNLLSEVRNGIGMTSVNKMILDIISHLGETSHSEEGYLSADAKRIISSLEDFKIAVQESDGKFDPTLNNLYKYNYITKNLADQIKNAMGYIYHTLPENAKTLLEYKARNIEGGMVGLLGMLLGSQNVNSIDFKLDLEVPNSSSSSNKDVKNPEINPAVAFLLDMGVETILPIVAGSSDALFLQAYRMPVTTKTGNPLGVTTLDKVSNTSSLGGIFDFSNVTMGDLVLDMASSKNIVVDGSSIYKVYLPFDQTLAAKGIITPNLNYLLLLEKVRKQIKEENATSPEEINAIYEKNNLPPFVDMNGNVNELFYKPFGVMNATALSDAFPTSVDLNDNFNFEEVDDDNEINNYWSIIKNNESKEEFDKKSFFNKIGFGEYQLMWKGLIYLPLNSTDPTLGIYSGGDNPSMNLLYDYRAKWLLEQRLNTYKPLGQLDL